ncbi:hypothetical protein HYDPIDRAFT_94784 [Hydnomerulius pinastri MD-312]|uniref:Aminoglycoside phosphotransferase domain-containing protein n=1 Tax=Hydnomerulius pinastri MD-312 TaxID=994086 RepID=A0A0C9WCK5_9AGAM|nr:hypothetical protein HYDPIDRAFT_94784 [Hydnomerulius pinastri MD-312]
MTCSVRVTLQQAQVIVGSHGGNPGARVSSFTEVKSAGYSYTACTRKYHIALSGSEKCYVLLASPLAAIGENMTSTAPSITLPALSALLTRILDSTSVPVPRPVEHNVSGGDGKWDFGWLLLQLTPSTQSYLPISTLASLRPTLSPRQLARIELRLGTYLRALHGITNEWFGVPVDRPLSEPPAAPSLDSLFGANQSGGDGEGGEGEDWTRYSWQDTFVLQLEELLAEVCGDEGANGNTDSGEGLGINVEELRRYLSRAIGSFLFEDVEMPRLIWVTGSEEDVIVSLTPEKGSHASSDTAGAGGEAEADIAYFLPTFGHALWGDPLMEAWFLPPGPNQAITEGYFDGEEGGALIVFPRQKTKRVWYTVYMALIVLAEERRRQRTGDGETGVAEGWEKVVWAKEVLPKCVNILKDAPCY